MNGKKLENILSFLKNPLSYTLIPKKTANFYKRTIETRFNVVNEKRNKIKELKSEISVLKKVEKKYLNLEKNLNQFNKMLEGIHATRTDIKKAFKKAYIYSVPKQIVSGDSFFLNDKEKSTTLVLSDSINHGPFAGGVSILNYTKIKEIVKKNKDNPKTILQSIDDMLIEENNKTEINIDVESAAIKINWDKNTIEYASKGRDTLLILKNNNKIAELNYDKNEIKTKARKKYREVEFKINEGDRIILYSDGYVDQNGGTRKRRFMTTKFNKLIEETKYFSVEEQGNLIASEFKEWKKNNKQVDDVSFIIIEYKQRKGINIISTPNINDVYTLINKNRLELKYELGKRLELNPKAEIKKDEYWPGSMYYTDKLIRKNNQITKHNYKNKEDLLGPRDKPQYEIEFDFLTHLHENIPKDVDEAKEYVKKYKLEGYTFYNESKYKIRDSTTGEYKKRKDGKYIERKRKGFYQGPKRRDIAKRTYEKHKEAQNKHKSPYAFYQNMKQKV